MDLTFTDTDQDPEVYVARLAEAYMRDLGFEVYREVRTGIGSPRADLVGKLGPMIWVCECKAQMGLQVISQAHHWMHRANFVSIACPRGQKNTVMTARHLLELAGIGWLVTQKFTATNGGAVETLTHPRFQRHRYDRWWGKYLNEAQKSFCEPGVKAGGWSPFKQTCIEIEKVVQQSPGIGLQELLVELKGKHHYKADSTAYRCIAMWARKDIIPNIKIFKEGKRLRLYHSTQTLTLA